MKLYAPSYYKNFRCIADKCKNNCCIGWEIDVDNDTIEKYRRLKNDYSPFILDSISMEDTPHFKLCEGERCPHLDERGLCKIIINCGDAYLCDICREHPRFYNYTNVAEVGIGMSCEEGARVILSSSEYKALEEIGEIDAEPDKIDFDGRMVRSEIYEILSDASLCYGKRLEKIYSKYQVNVGDDEKWLKLLSSLEYIDINHKNLFLNYSSKLRPLEKALEEYLERFLAYLIYRHCTEAVDNADFCVRLSFCLFLERLLSSLIYTERVNSLNDVISLATIISSEIEYSEDNTFTLM